MMRIFFILVTSVFLLFVFLRLVPVGQRVSTSDVKIEDGGDIVISRPRYLLPREFHSTGGMNPINFWSHIVDPTFEANRGYNHEFVDLDGRTAQLKIRGFHINRTFENPDFREDIIAVRSNNNTYEMKVEGFNFIGIMSEASFRFLGQDGQSLFYYYEGAKGYMPGFVRVALPLSEDKLTIVTPENVSEWENAISELKKASLNVNAISELCSDRFQDSIELAELLFKKSCK